MLIRANRWGIQTSFFYFTVVVESSHLYKALQN